MQNQPLRESSEQPGKQSSRLWWLERQRQREVWWSSTGNSDCQRIHLQHVGPERLSSRKSTPLSAEFFVGHECHGQRQGPGIAQCRSQHKFACWKNESVKSRGIIIIVLQEA